MPWSPIKFFWQHSLHNLAASTTQPGYYADNLIDGIEGTLWKPTSPNTQSIVFDAGSAGSIDADYFFMARHNLKTAGASIQLQIITNSNTITYIVSAIPLAWTEVQCMPTTYGRYDHSATLFDELYVYGGISNSSDIFNDLWKYNPTSNAWTQVKSGPGKRFCHSAVEMGNEMFVFGGAIDMSGTNIKELVKYSPGSDAWTTVACGATPRRDHSASVVKSEMYVFGGLTGTSHFNDLWKYNPTSNAWTQVACGATLRFGHTSVVISHEMYIFGGRYSNSMLNDLWKYNPTSNAWTQVACGATPRYDHGAATIGNEMYVFGGTNISSRFCDLWKYNPTSNAWSQVQCGAIAVYGQTLTVFSGDGLYIFGGLDNAFNSMNALFKSPCVSSYYSVYEIYSTTNVFGPIAAVDDYAYLKEFSQVSQKAWRLIISGSTVTPWIALAQWGLKTELGYLSVNLDPHAQEFKTNVNVGRTGYVVGMHEYSVQRNFKIAIETADDTLYQKIAQWRDGSRMRQFMVAWEQSSHSSEIWLMYPGPKSNNPMKAGGLYRDVVIELFGRRAE